MKKILLHIPLLLLLTAADAQVFNRLNAPVSFNETLLANPWAGGHNGPQWSKADLNNDGKDDLYAFDRNGDKHVTYINEGGFGEAKYRFAPQYAANFPECRYFTLLRDYDYDGIMDLFANSLDEGVSGLKVFHGYFDSENKLAFERLEFPWIFNVLLLEIAGAYTQLPVNSTDYPAIDDIDNDGDLDILAPSPTGGKIDLYTNLVKELGYTTDTLIFDFTEDCWGHLYLANFSQSFYLSTDSLCCVYPPCFKPDGPPETEDKDGLHGGAALCTFDENADNDKEILYGDLLYNNLIRGTNCGWTENAWVCEQDTAYPSYTTSVFLDYFPASFYLDIDNDDKRDLMVSPNLANGGDNIDVAWYYKNIGQDNAPVFEYQTRQLMVSGMIDIGTGAYPTFFDYDADGLLDIVAGNESYFTESNALEKDSRLHLFKNTGSQAQPSFELIDDDWLGFSQFVDPNLQPFAYAPDFGDVDGDGDEDLVVGDRHGRLFYGENIAGAGNVPQFGTIIPFWQSIAVGQFARPCIHDINKDGLGDLIVGEYNGTVNYMPNIGTVGNPVFEPNPATAPNNEFFGAINTQQPGWTFGYSAPTVLEYPDGTMDVVVGSQLGYLEHYRIDPALIGTFGGAFPILNERLGNLREGHITTPTFGDLNGDDFIDCVVGNQRGGFGLFSSPITKQGTVPAKEVRPATEVSLFPNPAGDFLRVEMKANGTLACQFRIFNAFGQRVGNGSMPATGDQLDISDLTPGIYFLQLSLGEEQLVRRFVKK